ncbi:hypothetical protein MBEHAL_0376 [Halarchaeum acidiphilum MH1-52-1]|uniref:Uncharacterized protein n=1 Tax=Halarchaeum acidiphilum MH1-52-1 TaxID=1261545 RepID=U2YD79_9EURY|nr:hypothetical protein MBEHAL_0376 [Halarchaeum acidiphilum MH1-52-1]
MTSYRSRYGAETARSRGLTRAFDRACDATARSEYPTRTAGFAVHR